MSVFRDNEAWRRNERGTTIKFFEVNLKNILTQRNISESKLASFLGKSQTLISRWVNGYDMPPSDIQELIAKILGCKDRAEIWKFKGNGKLHELVLKRIKLEKARQKLDELITKELGRL